MSFAKVFSMGNDFTLNRVVVNRAHSAKFGENTGLSRSHNLINMKVGNSLLRSPFILLGFKEQSLNE